MDVSSYTYTVTVSSSALLAGSTVKYRLFCFVVLCLFLFSFFLKDDLISGSD